jgi:hypothetical protein
MAKAGDEGNATESEETTASETSGAATAKPTPRASRRGSRKPSAASTASSRSPLELERDRFEPPADTAADTGAAELEPYEALPPEPLEWTPERAGAVVRGGAFLLHQADPLAHEEGGDELWRTTDADVDAIGPPLARILNRYAPARQLAGASDEVELALALGGYAKRNMALRGRLVRAKRQREEDQPGPEWPAPEPQA